MECPSCMEMFDMEQHLPLNLPCGHTFCLKCLQTIEHEKLELCPICRAKLSSKFKAKNLPKNFIALEYVEKHNQLKRKNKMCPLHPKEPQILFCNTCKSLMCVECVVSHSGHHFVKKEESTHVLRSSADELLKMVQERQKYTDELIQAGEQSIQELTTTQRDTLKKIDLHFKKLQDLLQGRRLKAHQDYERSMAKEVNKIKKKVGNYHQSKKKATAIAHKVSALISDLCSVDEKKIKDLKFLERLDDLRDDVDNHICQVQSQLQPLSKTPPEVMYESEQAEEYLKRVCQITYSGDELKNKKITFFGDKNKIMLYDIDKNKWELKTLRSSQYQFNYYAAAVTLPNGDALITGGGSSSCVFQYCQGANKLIPKRPMLQLRKEHAAVSTGWQVFVIGGYDGASSVFLKTCEAYSVEKDTWEEISPMVVGKCAFSATVVNKKNIFTFGGYDGTKRLDGIEKYEIETDKWRLLQQKLLFPLSNCACFSPAVSKVVILGGGFSSGFSLQVKMIDIETGKWTTLPQMTEGRDLRNKVVYYKDFAYAVGGYNFGAEKLSLQKKEWMALPSYLMNDNLDSWSCALTFAQPQNQHSLLPSNQEFYSEDDDAHNMVSNVGSSVPMSAAPQHVIQSNPMDYDLEQMEQFIVDGEDSEFEQME